MQNKMRLALHPDLDCGSCKGAVVFEASPLLFSASLKKKHKSTDPCACSEGGQLSAVPMPPLFLPSPRCRWHLPHTSCHGNQCSYTWLETQGPPPRTWDVGTILQPRTPKNQFPRTRLKTRLVSTCPPPPHARFSELKGSENLSARGGGGFLWSPSR